MYDAKYGDLPYRWVTSGNLFDVARVNLDTTAVDHVLLAVDQVKVTIAVGVAKITGKQPATTDRLVSEVGTTVVAGHQRRPTTNDFTDFPWRGVTAVLTHDTHRVEGRRRTHRTGLAQRLRLVENGPEPFREPVELVEAVGQQAIEQVLVLLVKWCAQRQDHLQRRQLVDREAR